MSVKKKVELFPNYATEDFFNNEFKSSTEVKRICIVSNHCPKELQELKELAEKNDIEVDIYGEGHIKKLITKKVLSNYDVIISIGKTVYYSLALGIPTYCYDWFGGYGYINKENIIKAFHRNFCGRGFGKKMSSKELYDDILNNYNNIKIDLPYLQKYARKNFCLEKNINKFFSLLNDDNKVNYDKIYSDYLLLNTKAGLYIDNINHKNNAINSLKNENEGLKKEITRLNNYIDDTVSKYKESTSWKITYPLRKLKEIKCMIFKKK
jgi:hypothetical protein